MNSIEIWGNSIAILTPPVLLSWRDVGQSILNRISVCRFSIVERFIQFGKEVRPSKLTSWIRGRYCMTLTNVKHIDTPPPKNLRGLIGSLYRASKKSGRLEGTAL